MYTNMVGTFLIIFFFYKFLYSFPKSLRKKPPKSYKNQGRGSNPAPFSSSCHALFTRLYFVDRIFFIILSIRHVLILVLLLLSLYGTYLYLPVYK